MSEHLVVLVQEKPNSLERGATLVLKPLVQIKYQMKGLARGQSQSRDDKTKRPSIIVRIPYGIRVLNYLTLI